VDDGELLRSILADVELAAAAFSRSPEAAVIHCPQWTVADLLAHHGGVLRWAETIVRTGEPGAEQLEPAEHNEERLAWYLDAAEQFVAAARRSDRDQACWTFGRPPGRAWFWIRRQALEAAVHRWDAERAVGAPTDIVTDLACIGITEIVEDLFPRQLALGRSPELSCAVELRAEDADQTWVLSPHAGESRAAVAAPASVLFLLLWRRAGIEDAGVSFTGSQTLLNELRASRFAP